MAVVFAVLSGAVAAPNQAQGIATDKGVALGQLEILGLPITGESFLQAVATGDSKLIDLCFAAGLDVNAAGPQGRTALHVAALSQDWDLIRKLLAAGAQPERADARGMTPLMAVALHGHAESLRALIARGANAAAVDSEGRIALHYALAAKKREAISLLLQSLPPELPSQVDTDELRSLAVKMDDWRILKPVLDRCDPLPTWVPTTRLELAKALRNRDVSSLRYLLSKHATPPTPENRRQPLLAYAVAMNDRPLFDLLLSAGADPNTRLVTPVEREFVEAIPNGFLKHYVSEDSGVTTLMLAAGFGRSDFVQALLKSGATRFSATEKDKMVALYFAARTESPECIQLLLGDAPTPEQVRIEVSLAAQQAVLYKGGAPVMRTEVSTGRPGFSTPTGQFVITDKHRDHYSTIYKVPMPYFMRLNCRDFGMHLGQVPNYPASHGCIRVPSEMAQRLFKEVPVGTLVSINP